MYHIISRRSFVCVGAALSLGPRAALAQGTTPLRAIYPVAVPTYRVLYVAFRKGFFKDEGLDVKLVHAGSGGKMREIVAAGDGELGMGDITHALQLTNRNRPAKILTSLDTRANGILIVGTEPFQRGATDLSKLAAYKRPDGRKPLIGLSSLNGTSHVWASYFIEQMKLEKSFTFLGIGDTGSMLGALKSQQIDCLALSVSALKEAEARGWGKLLFEQASDANWNRYLGGKVPVLVTFALQSTIDRDPARVQAMVNALQRANRWVYDHTAEEVYDQIEPYVGNTSREANLAEIEAGRTTADPTGTIDEASFARGARVYFREMTGIKPLLLAQVYAGEFVAKANATLDAKVSR